MLLNLIELHELGQLVERARLESTGPGKGYYCTEPLAGDDGKPYRVERKPLAGARPGEKIRGTDQVVKADDEGRYIEVPLGVHGRAFLAIDPRTRKIVCAACKVALKSDGEGGKGVEGDSPGDSPGDDHVSSWAGREVPDSTVYPVEEMGG